MKKSEFAFNAFSEVIPERALDWETDEAGRVVIRVPKFRNRFAVRYLLPRLKHPWVRVHLDDRGSLVWKACDGKTRVMEIAHQLNARFGDAAEPALERTMRFIHILNQQKFIRIRQQP